MMENIEVIAAKLKTALKTEVAASPELDLTSPNYLRTGITLAFINQQAIVKLLIQKEIFTKDEYLSEVAVQMLAEIALRDSKDKK